MGNSEVERRARPQTTIARSRRTTIPLALLAALVSLPACDMPRDADGTLERASGGVLRVGVSEAPPLMVRLHGATSDDSAPGATADDDAAGPEAELIREFARSIDARIEWHWGASNAHLHALERRELDVVAAGLTKRSPWAARVGFTRPWRVVGSEQHVLAVAPGENALLVALDRVAERARRAEDRRRTSRQTAS